MIVTLTQLASFNRRIALKPGHPEHISREMLQGLLEAGSSTAPGRKIDILSEIEMLIRLGYHTELGMTAKAYRELWPTVVSQPSEYADRFDSVLLVDTTIEVSKLAARNHNCMYVKLEVVTDLVPVATHPETGALLTRYVAFVQTGAKWLNAAVRDVRKQFATDEVGLTYGEGLHLPGQFAELLRKQAIDLPGSRIDEARALCVVWFDRGQPYVCGFDVGFRYPRFGSASRGTIVVPVT